VGKEEQSRSGFEIKRIYCHTCSSFVRA